jgi:hypothetical protein
MMIKSFSVISNSINSKTIRRQSGIMENNAAQKQSKIGVLGEMQKQHPHPGSKECSKERAS